jgi:hypothetical protein
VAGSCEHGNETSGSTKDVEGLLASHEGLCSMESVSQSVGQSVDRSVR